MDECLRIINRRIRTAQDEVARRKRSGLQYRPWQHRVQELEAVRREIAALATPEAFRAAGSSQQAHADRA
ncbi:MAG TPA: hypothetical protein VE685_05750 [Thermoanaerobaculia bacterium]|nr:hypothetical protein [Thermoanaerobaculia bacterium]